MAKDLRSKKINQITYISIGCAIAGLILFTTLFLVLNNRKNNEKVDLQIGKSSASEANSTQDASSSIGKTVDEMNDYKEVKQSENVQVQITGYEESNEKDNQLQNSNEIDNTNLANESNSENDTENANSNAFESNQEKELEDPTFAMPVDGEIMKTYGKEKLIYSDTLKEWTTHLGIDIKAEKTTIVKSASDGIIKSIKNDPRYGLTVVIEHNNGFTSVYSNLLTAEFVVVGEKVKCGQTIGTVGNSATFEILDAPHLHFEILKEGNSLDPEMYIK